MKARRIVLWAMAAAAVAVGAFAAYTPQRRAQFSAVDITGVPWGKGFELTDFGGKHRTLSDFRGKVVVLFFGYTSCPDMCPTTLALLAETMRQLGPDAGQVQGLFVTVDPRRDTPQVLSQYVPAFYPSFLGLYGDQAATERTEAEFKVYAHANPPKEDGSYTVDHSGQVFVFDRAGRIRLLINPNQLTPESISQDLRTLVRESAT